VEPRASLDKVEMRKSLTLPGLELRPFRRPARSQSLYRLRYPAPPQKTVFFLGFSNCNHQNLLRLFSLYFHAIRLISLLLSLLGRRANGVNSI
jgi:hypothetical protein